MLKLNVGDYHSFLFPSLKNCAGRSLWRSTFNIFDLLRKCKALWGNPRTLLRLSQRSTELSCTRFDEERSKKSKAIDEQRCGTVFKLFLREHISPRTSSTVVLLQVAGVCEIRTLAGNLGLVIVLDPACACQ